MASEGTKGGWASEGLASRQVKGQKAGRTMALKVEFFERPRLVVGLQPDLR
jgi:hypothetical protein